MEIIELGARLHLVKPVFGQAYVWQDGSWLTMVDTGIPGSAGDLARAFAELGYRRSDLQRVVITHGHEDHAGSAAAVRGWGDIEVIAHHADAPVVRGEWRRAEPVLPAAERPLHERVAAGMPALPPCAVDTEVASGDVIDFGDGAGIIAVPGHTDGSIAIWLPAHRVLFTGDTVANGTSGLILGPFSTDRVRARVGRPAYPDARRDRLLRTRRPAGRRCRRRAVARPLQGRRRRCARSARLDPPRSRHRSRWSKRSARPMRCGQARRLRMREVRTCGRCITPGRGCRGRRPGRWSPVPLQNPAHGRWSAVAAG